MTMSKVDVDLVYMPHYLHLYLLFPKGTGIVYEAEIIHFEHKREPSFLTTAAVFQPLFLEQNFSSHLLNITHFFGQMMNAGLNPRGGAKSV